MIGLVPIGRHGVHTHARRIAVQVEGELAGNRLQRLEFGGRRRANRLLQARQHGRRETRHVLGRDKETVRAAAIGGRKEVDNIVELLVHAVELVVLDHVAAPLRGKEDHPPLAAHELVGPVARGFHLEAELGLALGHHHGAALAPQLEDERSVAVELDQLVRLGGREVQLAARRRGRPRAVGRIIAAVDALGRIGPAIEHAALEPLHDPPGVRLEGRLVVDHRELLAVFHVGAVLHPAHEVADVLDHIGAVRTDHAEASADAVAVVAGADRERELERHGARRLGPCPRRRRGGLLHSVEEVGKLAGRAEIAHGIEPVPAVGMGRVVVAEGDRVFTGTLVGLGRRAVAAIGEHPICPLVDAERGRVVLLIARGTRDLCGQECEIALIGELALIDRGALARDHATTRQERRACDPHQCLSREHALPLSIRRLPHVAAISATRVRSSITRVHASVTRAHASVTRIHAVIFALRFHAAKASFQYSPLAEAPPRH